MNRASLNNADINKGNVLRRYKNEADSKKSIKHHRNNLGRSIDHLSRSILLFRQPEDPDHRTRNGSAFTGLYSRTASCHEEREAIRIPPPFFHTTILIKNRAALKARFFNGGGNAIMYA